MQAIDQYDKPDRNHFADAVVEVIRSSTPKQTWLEGDGFTEVQSVVDGFE